MLIKALIRIVLGILLTFAGFALGNIYFKSHPLFMVPYLGQTIAGFLGGAIGLFLLPILIELAKKSIQKMVVSIIRETTQQFQRRHNPVSGRSEEREKQESSATELNFLDTSAIIDGRIGEIVALGFLPSQLIVPRFILEELQHVADSTDVLKRNRGRRGLDLLEELRKNPEVKIRIIERDYPRVKEIDAKLIAVAKDMKGKIVTTDFNLNKVAKVSGVQVLNVNELANALKTTVLPGETIKVKVIQEGKELDQGVGYLLDGTMVVIENGKNLMGRTVEVEVSRIFQTAAGRMIFVQPLKNG